MCITVKHPDHLETRFSSKYWLPDLPATSRAACPNTLEHHECHLRSGDAQTHPIPPSFRNKQHPQEHNSRHKFAEQPTDNGVDGPRASGGEAELRERCKAAARPMRPTPEGMKGGEVKERAETAATANLQGHGATRSTRMLQQTKSVICRAQDQRKGDGNMFGAEESKERA